MEKSVIKKQLRKVFDAGMANQRLHPDDDSYDDVNFETVELKYTKYLKTLFEKLYEETKHGDIEHQEWLRLKIMNFLKNELNE